jgi:mannosyltransferase OCH1-like enzyme
MNKLVIFIFFFSKKIIGLMEIKLIHKEWSDYVYLNNINNRLNRISINDEYANFIIDKNILYVKWDKWGNEVFIIYNNDYYLCDEINLFHSDWEDVCYIDYHNKIIYRKSNNTKGNIYLEDNDELNIEWESWDEQKDSKPLILETASLQKNLKVDISPKDTNINLEKKIPNIIHFVYGFKEQIEEFDLYKYIAIKSAYDVNKPDKIYFYYFHEPYGFWWNKIKPYLTLEYINPPTEIYGNSVYNYAHKADIIRLQKLIEHGGIYLDIDTICLKSFSNLLHYDFLMGIQTNSDDTQVYGLCNAIILSKKNAPFAIKWLESYKTFRSKGRDEYWDEHSVLMPYELSKKYSSEIKILNSNAFFYPLWYEINEILFSENIKIDEYKKIIKNNYCIHLWDTYSNNYLKLLTEDIIFSKNTIYNIFCRKFLRNKITLVFLTYNRYDITVKCLESYLKCLDNDYIEELIILDNNSDKDIVDYLKKYQENHSKIKLIFSDDNLGVCNGRIILFNEAVGDIIISIDSDAYLINNAFFDKIIDMLYDESYGIIGISGAYIKSWDFGNQCDIDDSDENEYNVHHIAGCCQAFRKDLFNYGFELDPYYGKFWVEDTDLSMQSLSLNKINYRISQKNYLEHHWGGSGKNFKELFLKNWNYFVDKWKGKVLLHLE